MAANGDVIRGARAAAESGMKPREPVLAIRQESRPPAPYRDRERPFALTPSTGKFQLLDDDIPELYPAALTAAQPHRWETEMPLPTSPTE